MTRIFSQIIIIIFGCLYSYNIHKRAVSSFPINNIPKSNIFDTKVIQKVEKSVGLITLRGEGDTTGTCTGVLISPSHFLTSAHCILDAEFSKPLKGLTLSHVTFNFNDAQDSRMMSFPVLGVFDWHIETSMIKNIIGADFAILNLGPAYGVYPGELYGYVGIASNKAHIKSQAFIIHHPRGGLKKIGFAKLKSSNCSSIMKQIKHDFTITEGSSGSPIFNKKGKLIGINSNYNPISGNSSATCTSAIKDSLRFIP